MTVSLPEDVVLKLIRDLIAFPDSKVCVHYVAGNLLSALETAGFPLSQELAHAVVFAEDDEALAILDGLLESK
jgi:hypothetical protein